MTDVTQITGQEGDFNVTLNVRPRFVNDKCVACNKCAEVCPIERPNDFNYGLDNNKAAYLPFDMAFPLKYVIDMNVCLGDACQKCVKVCEYSAIDLNMAPETVNLNVGAIVLAGGWISMTPPRLTTWVLGRLRTSLPTCRWNGWLLPTAPPPAKFFAPPMVRSPKKLPSSNAPAPGMKTICRTAPTSAAWLP